MSTRCLNLAWDVELPLTRKMVLIALADQANDNGECYPGIRSMLKRCSMSRAAIFQALAALEEDGFLTRRTIGGGQKTLYVLQVIRLSQASLLGPFDGPSTTKTVQQVDRPAGGRSSSETSGGPPGGLHKATNSKATSVYAREDQLDAMGTYDRSLITPFLRELPEGIALQTFADFIKHRQVKGGPESISSWKQLLQHMRDLVAAGVDLEKSLTYTMLAKLYIPVDPRTKGRGGAPPKARANDDFSTANYTGTPDDEIPTFLRN